MYRLNRVCLPLLSILSVCSALGDRSVTAADPPSLAIAPPTVEAVHRVTVNADMGPLWTTESEPSPRTVARRTGEYFNQVLINTNAGAMKGVLVDDEHSEATRSGNKWLVLFLLKYQGIPLTERSNLSGIVSTDATRVILRQRNFPVSLDFEINEETKKPVNPIPVRQAAEVALAQLAKRAQERDIVVDFESYAPRDARLEIWVDAESRVGHLAWSLIIAPVAAEDVNERQIYRVWVSAAKPDMPRVLEIKELVSHSHHGQVEGPVWDPTPLSSPTVRPLPHVTITRNGGSGANILITDPDGVFDFEDGNTPTMLVAELKGPFFRVVNTAGDNFQVAINALADQPTTVAFAATDETSIAQVSSYYWAHKARAFTQSILADDDLTEVRLRVNVDDECNASWNSFSNTLSLFRASLPGSERNCVNRSYSDTVFHEFGHAVDFANGGILDGAYSEGFGDSVAILHSRDSRYGRDCCGPGTTLRDASESVNWPQNDQGIHRRGRIYAGFTWQLVQELLANYSEDEAVAIAKRLTLEVAQRNPMSIKNAVELAFEQDDDDFDLSNGTPHFEELAAAADSRSIPRPPDPAH